MNAHGENRGSIEPVYKSSGLHPVRTEQMRNHLHATRHGRLATLSIDDVLMLARCRALRQLGLRVQTPDLYVSIQSDDLLTYLVECQTAALKPILQQVLDAASVIDTELRQRGGNLTIKDIELVSVQDAGYTCAAPRPEAIAAVETLQQQDPRVRDLMLALRDLLMNEEPAKASVSILVN